MTDLSFRRRGLAGGPALVALAMMLAACTSTPKPEEMARTTLDTAPADLQLLCATSAADAAKLDPGKVLPVSSQKLDSRNYRVDLNANGKPTACVIDADGKIISMTPG